MNLIELGEREYNEWWRLQLLAASEAHEEQVADTAEWLGISRGAYYRRRRGEIPFSAFEVAALSQRFGLASMPTAGEAPRFDFAVPLSADTAFNERHYVQQLDAAFGSFPDPGEVQVLVSTTDIPVFYLFAEPDLAALKRYLFGLAIDASGARRFSLAVARREHAEFVHRAAALSRVYRQTHREEAWGPSPLRSLLYQILLLVESAAIAEPDCEQLFVAIERVVDRLERALVADQTDEPRLRLWQNRLHATSSLICAEAGAVGRLFVTFDNPNFFHSESPEAVAYFQGHFEALRRRSLRVAGHGSLSPARYASELRDHIARGRAQAERAFATLGEEL